MVEKNGSEKPLPNVEEVLEKHESFIRRARHRAQQMLYFLEFGRPTSDEKANAAIREYRNHGANHLENLANLEVTHKEDVDRLLKGLMSQLDQSEQLPDDAWWSEDAYRFEDFERQLQDAYKRGAPERRSWKEAWKDRRGHTTLLERKRTREDLLQLWRCRHEILQWMRVTWSVPSEDDSDHSWMWARNRVLNFLWAEGGVAFYRLAPTHYVQISRETWLYLKSLRNLPHWTLKHLAALTSVGVALFVLFKVEAINSLLTNMWRLLPLFLVVFIVLPFFVPNWRALAFWRPRRDEVSPWDIGGEAHRCLLPMAREPQRLVERWPTTAPGDESVSNLIVRGWLRKLATVLSVCITVLFAASLLVYFDVIDSTRLTVLAILILLCSLFLVASYIDFWDFVEPGRIRLYILLWSVIGLWATLKGWGFFFGIVASLVLFLWFLWTHFRRPGWVLPTYSYRSFLGLALLITIISWTQEQAVWKLESRDVDAGLDWHVDQWPMPGRDPVVVIAASGGGSRAAVYTALTLDALAKLAEHCEGGSSGCRISSNLQAISSVSGGSLANAGYVVRRLAASRKWEVSTSLVDAVSEDFLLPTIWGAIWPFLSRGDAIERAWQGLDELQRHCPQGTRERTEENALRLAREHVALGGTCLSDLAAEWSDVADAGSRTPPFPMPLFNATTLDGHDLVISPLAQSLYASGVEIEARDPQRNRYDSEIDATWVYYRDGIYSLEDVLGPSYNPLISASVRASANFPFGFPLVDVDTRQPLMFHPKWRDRCEDRGAAGCRRTLVQLTDGGAISNSGLWSLFRLLMNRDGHSDDLKDRGVLLIVVDASLMPELSGVGPVWGLRTAIADQAPLGQYLHREMFELLRREYGERIAIEQINLPAEVDKNVYTTWALDPETRERLGHYFDEQWKKDGPCLLAKWDYLTRGTPLPEGCPRIELGRLPVD